jgi:MFS superfamily sulfate permease-like transporter
MLAGARWRPTVPFSLLAAAAATLAAELTGLEVARIGDLPAGLPAPSLAFLDVAALGSLIAPAVAVAALAGLESLLSAAVADGLSGRCSTRLRLGLCWMRLPRNGRWRTRPASRATCTWFTR